MGEGIGEGDEEDVAADRERQELLLRNLQIQGRLVAQSLEDSLKSLGPKAVVEAAKAGGPEKDIKLKEASDAIARLVRS